MKNLKYIFLLILVFNALCAKAQQSQTAKTITGKVTYFDAPLPNVNISVIGSSRGTTTNSKGLYSIIAKVGEEIEFSHLSFKSVSILIEDTTKELFIEMVEKTNDLDEIVITVKKVDGTTLKQSKRAERKFNTSRGSFDPRTSGYSIAHVEGKSISNVYSNIKEALTGKIPGFQVINNKAYMRGASSSITQDYPVAWEVDGVFMTEEPFWLDLSQIKDVFALKSTAATNKYGTLGAGGVIVIQTKQSQLDPETSIEAKTKLYTNKNTYNNDALSREHNLENLNVLTQKIGVLRNNIEAVNYYQSNKDSADLKLNDYLTIATLFSNRFNNKGLSQSILNNQININSNNSEILKTIAYTYQYLEMHNDAINTYKKIIKLRPNYAQSYRDLANAYIGNNQYKMAWRIYLNYMMNKDSNQNSNIDEIIYNEMEYLHYTKSNEANIKTNFVPINPTINDFRNDVRIIVEWNTSEAEFDLEFVNPKLQAYKFEHSLAISKDLITDEKKRGYSSKEFMIETIGQGDWLMNIEYYGNKTNNPTFFKITEYYNWGKANQYHKISVIPLKSIDSKLQLLKINSSQLNR